MSLIITGSPV